TRLKQIGVELLQRRITTAATAMSRAQEAANAEEKSSSGDKCETGRAMGQLEREMYGRQSAEYERELKALQAVAVDVVCARAGAGALVQVKGMAIFMCAGLGKQQVDGQTVLFVSPKAPLAQALQGKKPGDDVMINAVKM